MCGTEDGYTVYLVQFWVKLKKCHLVYIRFFLTDATDCFLGLCSCIINSFSYYWLEMLPG